MLAGVLEGAVLKAIDDWLQSSDAAEAVLGKRATADQQQNVRHQPDALITDADAGKGSPERLAAWAARLVRIDLDESSIAIELETQGLLNDSAKLKMPDAITIRSRMEIGPRGQGLRLLLGERQDAKQASEAMSALLCRAHYWRNQWFAAPEKTLAELIKASNEDKAEISRILPLAFLAPDIVDALLQGKSALTAKRLRRLGDLPADWADQRRLLALTTS